MPYNTLAPADPAPLQLVDEREAAAILSVAVNTLRNWRWKGGEGPRWRKIGPRCVRYAVADLHAFIEGEGGAA